MATTGRHIYWYIGLNIPVDTDLAIYMSVGTVGCMIDMWTSFNYN